MMKINGNAKAIHDYFIKRVADVTGIYESFVNQPDNVYQMHGNQITVRTLDLNKPFSDIAKQLNTIAETHFDLPERSKG